MSIYIVANTPTYYEASMTTLVVLWLCLFGENFVRGDILYTNIKSKTSKVWIKSQKRAECSRKHPGPHGHCCLLVCSLWRTFTFVYYFLATIQMCSFYIVAMTLLLYEASIGRLGDFDHELVIVHEIFTCSWNDHHISRKTFVIIILVTNFSHNLRDHYIGNEFLAIISWSLYW